jgi:hypothetical protein
MATVSGKGASVLLEWTYTLMAKIVMCQKKGIKVSHFIYFNIDFEN